MIAATPDMSSCLGLLSAVLRSLQSEPGAEISPALKEHTFAVLKAAAAITADPRTIAADTMAEAIELAQKLQGDPALSRRLGQLADFSAIRPEVAAEVLRSLRSIAA